MTNDKFFHHTPFPAALDGWTQVLRNGLSRKKHMHWLLRVFFAEFVRLFDSSEASKGLSTSDQTREVGHGRGAPGS